MERSRNTQKFQNDSETINEVRPAELVASNAAARHALNYSIQTGEEFSLEFMRDKAVPSRPYITSAASGEQTIGSNYVDLRRRRTISNARPGNESDTRARAAENRALSNAEKKSFAEMNSRDYQALTRTYSQASTSDSSYRGFHRPQYASSEPRVKFLCSYGGKFLPRPSDGKLRYVGGDTRILRISKGVSWKEFMRIATALYNQTHIIKYQLPGEDIDALVSVLCDEDLQHMIDECAILEDSDKSPKPRMFLFSSDDNENMNFSLAAMEGDFETHYVTAINGLDASSEVSASQVLGSASGDEIDRQFPIFSVELDEVKPRSTPIEVAEITFAPDAVISNAPIQANLTTDSDIHPQHKDRRRRNIHHHNAFSSDENGIPIPSSMPSEYDRLAHSAPACETSPKPADKQSIPHWNRAEEFSDDLTNQDQNTAKGEAKAVLRGLGQHMVAAKETQSGHGFSSPVQQHGVSLSYLELESPYETSAASFMSSKYRVKHLETQVSSALDIGGAGGGVATESSNYKPKVTGVSSDDPHSRVPRLFCKDQMPLKQEKLASQLSDSKDSVSSQRPALDQFSYKKQEQGEVLDPLPEEGLAYEFGNLVISARPQNSNPINTRSELREIQRFKSLAPVTLMNQFGLGSTAQMPEKSSYAHVANREEKTITMVSDLASRQADNITDIKSNEFQKKADKSNRNYSAPSLTDERNRSAESSSSDGKTFVPKVCCQELLGDGSETTKSISPSLSTGIIPKQKESPTILPDVVSNSISKVITYEEMSNISTSNNRDSVIALKMISNENQTPLLNMFHDEITSKDASLERQNHVQEAGVAPLEDRVVLGLKNPQVDFSEVENSLANVGEYLRSALLEYEENVSDNNEAKDQGSDAPLEVPDYLRNVQIINNEDLEELRELGAGTFGTVYHGKWRGTDVAIKRIKNSYFTGQPSQTDKMILGFWREVGILSKLHHPNVLAFYGIVKDEPGGTLATVTEYMAHGSLKHVLQRKERHLDYRKRLLIAMDAAIGMEYLHSRSVVHFDLKCDNLLVNLKDQNRPICKVCDFGLSKMKPNTMVSGGVRGTLPWMAPELLYTSGNKVSEKIDVYSFGIVLWEILTGEEPYADMHYGEVIGGLLHNTLRPPVPASCDRDWRTLMEQCWAADPAQRPTFTQIASHLKAMYKSSQSRASSG